VPADGSRGPASPSSRLLSSACLFCQIAARQSPADIQYEDDEVLAFRDLYPKAPVHLLIVPKRHIESVLTLEPGDVPLVGRLILTARRIGESMGFGERGYRLAINCGPEGGQHVGHLHVHFLAGRLQERRVERR
jgi:histidine triad (HIT) family protein